MKFRMIHNNFNVLDLDKSLKFYAEALDMKETRRISAPDGSFIIVYLKCDKRRHLLELTWMRIWTAPTTSATTNFTSLSETDDYEAAHARHKAMGCICYENPEMGIYFISDPDGYWLEILSARK